MLDTQLDVGYSVGCSILSWWPGPSRVDDERLFGSRSLLERHKLHECQALSPTLDPSFMLDFCLDVESLVEN